MVASIITQPANIDMRVWVQNTPLIVDELCDDPFEAAAWRALNWLMTVFPDRRGFGTREIARRAKIGRKSLSRRRDPRTGEMRPGVIDRLAAKGLIDIVGYETVPNFPNPRPIYSIDHKKLMQASMEAAPAVLRDFSVTNPPPPPHPDQMTMFDLFGGGWGDMPPEPPGPPGPPGEYPGATMSRPPGGVAPHGSPPGVMMAHGHGPTEPQGHGAYIPHADAHGASAPQEPGATGIHDAPLAPPPPQIPALPPDSPPQRPEAPPDSSAPSTHGVLSPQEHGDTGPQTHGDEPHQMREEKEGKNERENDEPLTPSRIQSIATETARAVVLELLKVTPVWPVPEVQPEPEPEPQPQPAPTPPADIPPAPPGEPPLPAAPAALWQADQPGISQRDSYHLDMLAHSYDAPTDGYGAYWLGRAILMADYCLTPKGQPVTIQYVRGILKRWARPDAEWGSDLDNGHDEPAAAPAVPEAASAAPPSPASARAPEAEHLAHPAVRAYLEQTDQPPATLDRDLAAMIAEAVPPHDQHTWRALLADWKASGWNLRNVKGMLDRYRRETGNGPVERVSDAPIWESNLTPAERKDWIDHFREIGAREGPAGQRRVINELLAMLSRRENP